MSATRVYLSIDGKFRECSSAEDFGYLGLRSICKLGDSPGQPEKKLLIRSVMWPQPGQNPLRLAGAGLPKDGSLPLRPVVINKYEAARSQADGKLLRDQDPSQILQQDVTRLASLRESILVALQGGDLRRFWSLFYYCRKTLDRFGERASTGGTTPLQFPQSLAVGQDNLIVPLDAEVRVSGSLPVNSSLSRAYAEWFGGEGANGFVQSRKALRLHANALLRYFRGLLAQLNGKVPPAVQAVVAQALVQAGQLQPDMPLDDLKAWIRETVEDWDLPLDDEDPVEGTETIKPAAPRARIPSPHPPRRSSLLRLSLWLNLLLACVVIILLWLWPRAGSRGATETNPPSPQTPQQEESDVLHSSYCVVFRMEGTTGEGVGASLRTAFPDGVIEIEGTTQERDRLLATKRAEAVKSVKDHGKVKELLARLAANHSVEFKGFTGSDPADRVVASVIGRGGVFTIKGSRHGSLLQSTGLDTVASQADLEGADREILTSLKRAVADYASLDDALGILAERGGYLVKVTPTRQGHEKVRRELTSRVEKPVFVSRPLPQLFGAVDPTADKGGGLAEYTLQLDRPGYWRVPSQKDRLDIDFQVTRGKDRMKWQRFRASERVTWIPLPITRTTGEPAALATFDVAVELSQKVVIFRNQSILVGRSKEEILTQGKNYISRVLQLPGPAEEAISVSERGGQFTGALKYSYLAGRITAENRGRGHILQSMKKEEFEQLKQREDR